MEQTRTGDTIVAGNTHRFEATFVKGDGTSWDLTDYSVAVEFRKADGTIVSRSASKVTPNTLGKAYYENPTSEFDPSLDGAWSRAWVLSKTGVVLKTLPILFVVEESP